MTICCCLSCIEGFGRCSSAPKPDPMSAVIERSNSDAYGGITSFGDPYKVAPFNFNWWNPATVHTEDKS